VAACINQLVESLLLIDMYFCYGSILTFLNDCTFFDRDLVVLVADLMESSIISSESDLKNDSPVLLFTPYNHYLEHILHLAMMY